MSVLIALGPCLMMGMAMLALFVVHWRFSQTRHALLWATACGAGMLQWGLMALQGAWGASPLHSGPLVDFLGLASVLLLAEGFRMRARAMRLPTAVLATAVLTTALMGLLFVLPPMAIRGAITPLVSVGLFVWMASMVAGSGHRATATGLMVTAILLAVALVHAVGAALAIGEQFGLLHSHRPYQLVYLATVEPMAAAIALVTLMLIALDFSVELRRLVHTDPLTGVLNRGGFDHAALLALEHSKRRSFTIAVADIDRFKEVNDRHGHLVGDRALCSVARHLADWLGREGTVARIGGEEFALLLPGLDAAAAFARVERLRASLADVRVDGQSELRLSASFGLAQRAPGEPLPELIERADRALYRSKRAGRNRTTLAKAAATKTR